MGSSEKALAVLGLGGLALWASRSAKAEPVPSGGAVAAAASIGSVKVSQSVQLGSHRLEKRFGDLVLVDVQWTPGATDPLGDAVEWPYLIVARLGHNTLFGWRQAGDDINGVFGEGHREVQRNGITATQGERFIFPAPLDDDQEWDVRVWVFAQPDDDGDGEPDGDPTVSVAPISPLDLTGSNLVRGWQSLDSTDHPAAIVTRDGYAVNPVVTWLSVTVSQKAMRRTGLRLRR